MSTSPAGQEDRIYEVFERQARSQLCFSSQVWADAHIRFKKLPSHEVKSSIFLFFIYLFISIHSEFIIYCKFKYFQDTFMAKLQKDWVQLVKQCKNSGYTLLLCLPILTAGILITIIKQNKAGFSRFKSVWRLISPVPCWLASSLCKNIW